MDRKIKLKIEDATMREAWATLSHRPCELAGNLHHAGGLAELHQDRTGKALSGRLSLYRGQKPPGSDANGRFAAGWRRMKQFNFNLF